MFAVRPIKLAEIRPMVAAGEVLHRQSAYGHMTYDRLRVERLALSAMSHPNEFFLQVITYHDQPCGVLFARISDSWFGPDKVTRDLVFFIVPEMQGKCRIALQQIVDNYREWATACGVKMVNLACSTQIKPEKTRALFETLGFPQTGSLHALTV